MGKCGRCHHLKGFHEHFHSRSFCTFGSCTCPRYVGLLDYCWNRLKGMIRRG